MIWILAVAFFSFGLGMAIFPLLTAWTKREKRLMLSILICVPVFFTLGFGVASNGSMPSQTQKPAAPPMAAQETPQASAASDAPDPLKMVASLERKLANSPGTAEQWAMLARSYVTLNRQADAAKAFAKATEMNPADAQLYADYADAIAMTRGGLDQDSENLIDKALQIDPAQPKALSLKATIAFNKKDYQAAIRYWEKILAAPDLSKDWEKMTRDNIEESKRLLANSKQKSTP